MYAGDVEKSFIKFNRKYLKYYKLLLYTHTQDTEMWNFPKANKLFKESKAEL